MKEVYIELYDSFEFERLYKKDIIKKEDIVIGDVKYIKFTMRS